VTGESTQHRGVEPDVPLPSPIDTEEVGESSLEAALPWDRIASVPFTVWRADQRPAVAVPALAVEEDERAQKDPDYRWLTQEISASEELRGQHSISLNLKARQEERTRRDKDRLARENLRRAAKGTAPAKSVEEIEASEAPDIVLAQSAQIMADMVTGAHTTVPGHSPPRQTVRREDEAGLRPLPAQTPGPR